MSDSPKRPLSFPAVPASFMLLLVLCAGFWWWFGGRSGGKQMPLTNGVPGTTVMFPIRIPGGTLKTHGLVKSEELHKETKSWGGTTSSSIRLTATYHYEIELKKEWSLHVDEERGVAFAIAPTYKPILPVGFDTKTLEVKTSSGWLRFNKWEHLLELQKEISPHLEERAKSDGYLELARDQARRTVKEFVIDWMLEKKDRPNGDPITVEVYFADEKDIPFPPGLSLEMFLP